MPCFNQSARVVFFKDCFLRYKFELLAVFFHLLKGRVFTTTIVSLNIPEGVLFTDFVKRLKNDRCFHELN